MMMRSSSGSPRRQLPHRGAPIRAGAICAAALQSVALLFVCMDAQAYQATAQTRAVSAESNTIGYAWDEFQEPFFPAFDSPNLVVPSTPTVDTTSASDFDASWQ